MSDHSEAAALRLPANACQHLCTKTLYTNTFGKSDGTPKGIRSETAAWWCEITQTVFGPDQELVEPESCLDPRSCCRPLPRPRA